MNEDKYIPTPAGLDFLNEYLAKTLAAVAEGVSKLEEKQTKESN